MRSNKRVSTHESDLERALARGPLAASDLLRVLSIAKSTLKRAVDRRREALLIVGRARATRYAIRRRVEGVVAPLPVYAFDAAR